MVTFKFECRTTKPPRPFKWEGNSVPMNLEEMLKMIRRMGMKPSDISIGEMEWVYERHDGYDRFNVPG